MKTSRAVLDHLLSLWQQATRLYLEGDYPLAVLAITLLEEVGKLVIAGNNEKPVGKVDKKAFFNHRSKYRYAVGATLFVNSRVTRVYGHMEAKFASWFREDELFSMRNRCLYLGERQGTLSAPKDSVSKDDVSLLVCIAGESLAEIQGFYTGTGPEEWATLLVEVDQFRESIGLML